MPDTKSWSSNPRLVRLRGRLARRGFAWLMLIIAPLTFAALRQLGVDIDLAAALALGVPSLFYAAIQFNAANGTAEKLVQLELQLSTRRLDEAPHFLCDIVELLEKER